MEEKAEAEKRKSRSEVILDVDDLEILRAITPDKYASGMMLDALKKEIGLSHNALLVHLKRLIKNDLVVLFRSKEDYKFKVVLITGRGRTIKKLFGIKPKEAVLNAVEAGVFG